ncbi:MAG TPA: hypothetical protein VM008_11105 [Phycisphaerae bacterium]|nr:hypothetical protein [Phycisphaerae bacterium]
MMPISTLAYTIFFDAITSLFPNMDEYWLLLVIPLVVAITLVYKGTRMKELRTLPRDATIMSVQILVLMVFAAAALGGLYWIAVRVL